MSCEPVLSYHSYGVELTVMALCIAVSGLLAETVCY